MQNIKISYEIMAHINNIINKINDPILFQVIPKT